MISLAKGDWEKIPSTEKRCYAFLAKLSVLRVPIPQGPIQHCKMFSISTQITFEVNGAQSKSKIADDISVFSLPDWLWMIVPWKPFPGVTTSLQGLLRLHHWNHLPIWQGAISWNGLTEVAFSISLRAEGEEGVWKRALPSLSWLSLKIRYHN